MKRDKRTNNSLPNTGQMKRDKRRQNKRTNNSLPNTAVNQRRTDNTMAK